MRRAWWDRVRLAAPATSPDGRSHRASDASPRCTPYGGSVPRSLTPRAVHDMGQAAGDSECPGDAEQQNEREAEDQW